MNLPLAASSWQRPGLFFSSALPGVRVRFPARLFCQGRPLRSPERTLRGLDSASRKAPETARKSICFIFFKRKSRSKKGGVGVGIMIAHNPLHGSGQADFPHPALALGDDANEAQGIGMTDGRQRQPASDEAPHAIPEDVSV